MDLRPYLDATYPEDTKWPFEIPGATRGDLPGLFASLGFTKGAEIGVWRGAFSTQLCEGIPGLELYCVDPYRVHHEYLDMRRQDRLEESFAIAQKALSPYRATFIRDMSLNAAKVVRDGSLDFVYIDGNHRFEACAADLGAWVPKVRPGGIVAGHDYAFIHPRHLLHVYWAVNGFTEAYGIRPWFILGRGRDAIRFRRDDPNRYRSFCWVRR